MPVVEEELVVTKRLVLKEEIHLIKKRMKDRVVKEVELGRERATVRRVNSQGNVKEWHSRGRSSRRKNQISVPAEVRKRLGIGPGSVIEWEEEGCKVVVRGLGSTRRSTSIEGCSRKGHPHEKPSRRWTRESGSTCGRSMRAADTNVVVRMLVRDDPAQAATAIASLRKAHGFRWLLCSNRRGFSRAFMGAVTPTWLKHSKCS